MVPSAAVNTVCATSPSEKLTQMEQSVPSSAFDVIVTELQKKLQHIVNIGLQYLTLDRRTDTLSGGERQRLKPTKQLKQSNKIIVLDEPSIGLHPNDTEKLLNFINNLVDNHNTLIVIEHNLDVIAQADWIIDIGLGAGKYGGNVVFTGTVADLLNDTVSLTAAYLRQHFRNGGMHAKKDVS